MFNSGEKQGLIVTDVCKLLMSGWQATCRRKMCTEVDCPHLDQFNMCMAVDSE